MIRNNIRKSSLNTWSGRQKFISKSNQQFEGYFKGYGLYKLISLKDTEFGKVRFFLAQALHNPLVERLAQPPFCSMIDQRSETTSSMLLLPVFSNKLSFSRSLSSTSSIALIGVVGVSDTFGKIRFKHKTKNQQFFLPCRTPHHCWPPVSSWCWCLPLPPGYLAPAGHSWGAAYHMA